MKKLLISLLIASTAFTGLFSMTATEKKEYQKLKEEKAKEELKKELKKELLKEMQVDKETEKKLSQEERDKEMFSRDFQIYRAQERQRIALEGAKTVLRVENNSKWNIVVLYKHKDHPQGIQELIIKRERFDDVPDPHEVTYLKIVPYSSYWEKKLNSPYWDENLQTLAKEGVIEVPDLGPKIAKTLELNPNESVEIEVTIPKLTGGKFKGFKFEVKPKETEEFEMTEEEYIKRRKSGKLGPPDTSDDEIKKILSEVDETLAKKTK